MTRVEFDHTCAVGAGRADLPLRLDRGIPQSRNDDVAAPEGRGYRFEPRLAAELREGPVGLRARTVGIHSRRGGVRIRPVRAVAGVADRSSEALGEALVDLRALEWRKRREIDASAGLDVWDRESTERVADDDRVRLRPHLAGIVERRQSDLLAGQVGTRDLMTSSLEFPGKPAEATAAVPDAEH